MNFGTTKSFRKALAGLLVSGFAFYAAATPADFGDAPGYGNASNQNPSWQRLGTAWDAEAGPLANDLSDDGVSWSIDGGLTYGHDYIDVGTSVIFKFEMYKELWGTHDYDALKAWIDTDMDNTFEASELVISDQWNFASENPSMYSYSDNPLAVDEWGNSLYYADSTTTFYTTVTFNNPGDYWMRARVVCDDDLGVGGMANLTPYGGFFQGETEDWNINVVPEPGIITMLFASLFSLAAFGRRKKR